MLIMETSVNVRKLQGLCVKLNFKPAEDLSIIFAEPGIEDLEKVLNDNFILKLVKEIINNPDTNDNNDLYGDSDSNNDIVTRDISDIPNNEVLINNEESLLQDDMISTPENDLRARLNETVRLENDQVQDIQNFKDTLSTNNAGKHECDKCGKSYKAIAELKNHILTIHEGFRYQCSKCQGSFSSVQALKRHEKHLHSDKTMLIKKHVCHICDQAFTLKDTLKKHIFTHDKIKRSDPCSICGKVFKNKNVLRQHLNQVHEENLPVVCEECGKKFPNNFRLKVHNEMVHMKGVVYVCQACGKSCVGQKRLNNHMASKHPKQQKFVNCDICHQEIGEKQMRSHIIQIHKAHNFKLSCDYCDKRFAVKGQLKRHLRVHTKARPYQCKGCDNCFVDLATLKQHIRKKHEEGMSLVFYDPQKDAENLFS